MILDFWLASAVVVASAFGVVGCGSGVDQSRSATTGSRSVSLTSSSTPAAASLTAPRAGHRGSRRPQFAVGLRVVTFIDSSRLVQVPGVGLVPRKLVTLVRYPAAGSPTRVDVVGAPPERAGAPFPLLVFGHGFAVTPAVYAPLLRAWARAGYIVAAPLFPLENANAPGGPNESDLVNQPRDMSFVISRMLAASADSHSVFARLINQRAIAVAGQSDGGETALAVAYDRSFLDRRVRAALILSGAEIPGVGGFDFPAPSPPLLATQGTADVVNPPSRTDAFFDIAPAPKYLLTLLAAPHLGPYTDEQPQLGIVERVTIAFLDRYLKHGTGAGSRLMAAGDVPGVSVLKAER
jgi:predicted dienelactone hydrolase